MQTLGLTPAEANVATLLEQGESVSRICERLGIKTSTARTHLRNIFDKLGVRRQPEAVARLAKLKAMRRS